MTRVAVIAHRGKTLGGGLAELRRVLERARRRPTSSGARCRRASTRPKQVEKALDRKRRPVFVWGGDGMVQRCVDVLAGTKARARDPAGRHREPAGDQPRHPEGRRGRRSRSASPAHRRRIDVGRINGERFAVMAGAGFDARMIGDADGGLKDRFGRLAYVWTGAKNLRDAAVPGEDRASTARAGSTARRAASCSATSASSSAASRRSRTRAPTTACSSSASSRPTASRSGRGRSRAPSSARAASPRTRTRRRCTGAHQARPQGALRARRRRPQEGAQAAHRRRARRRRDLRAGRPA